MTEESIEQLRKHLEEEQEKNKRLEDLLRKEEAEVSKKIALLNELYRRIMLEGLTDREEIARVIGKEQYESLSYHLAKEHQKRVEVEKKLKEEDKQLEATEAKIKQEEDLLRRNEERLSNLEKELNEERQRRIKLEKRVLTEHKPAETSSDVVDFIDEIDLSDLDVTNHIEEHSRPVHKKVTTKDLIGLLLRIHRLKAVDASIMLNTSKTHVLQLARPLADRGYVKIEGAGSQDPVIRALDKLIKLKKH